MLDFQSIRMPTEDELTAQAVRRCADYARFSLHNLPFAALDISIATDFLPLSDAERDGLVDQWRVLNNEPLDGEEERLAILATLAARIDRSVTALGGRAFVRLGTRSPKDSYSVMNDASQACVTNGKHGVFLLTDSMERVILDLETDRRAKEQTVVCVRRFIEIRPWQELRCFVNDGKVVGLTQYHCGDVFPEMIERRQDIENAAREFLERRVVPALASLSSYTADLIFDNDLGMTLLEVNPPVTSGNTFPGLFMDHPLDGSFLVVENADQARP